jgi:galactose-6-phosphate isomerase
MSVLAGGFLQPALGAYLLMDKFQVLRRTETVNLLGRVAQPPPIQTFNNIPGTIGPTSPNDLARLPDLDLSKSTLSAVTTFRLRGPAPGFLPDHVIWHGDTYQVMSVNDFSAYGGGFVQAVLQMVDAQAEPPDEFVAAPGSPA